MPLTNFGGHKWPSKKVLASCFLSFCYSKIPLMHSIGHRWLGKKVRASCLSSFGHSEIAFEKVISSIRL